MAEDQGTMLRNMFKLKKEYSVGFYLTDFLFRKILRQNSGVRWPIHHTSTIHRAEKIKKGKNVFPGDSPCIYINANNGFEIGDYSNLGPNVGIITSNHDFVNNEIQTQSKPVIIGRFCWLGMNAVVLPEVQLGDFTIVGAGAVVTKSFPEGYCVIGGNPAKVLRTLNREECESFAKTKL